MFRPENHMDWKLKLAAKVLAGRLPVLKRVLRRWGYFRLGNAESASYARGVFERHASQAETEAAHGGTKPRGTCLEIGPGESLLTPLLARAAGFDRVLLVDEGWQLDGNTRPCTELSRLESARGGDVPEIHPGASIPEVLRACAATYLTSGLASLAALDDGSADFSFSHAVLEHIPRSQALEYLRQLKRVTKASGVSSHHIDLKDHLGGSLNQLRFSHAFWEGGSIRRSGIYTNRLRYSEWLRLFEEAGLAWRIVSRSQFVTLPLERRLMDPAFRDLEDDDLRTQGFQVVFTGGG
jgi:hypothetical protein